jgi:hypothetical protein
MSSTGRKESVRFAKAVSAGTTEELTYRVEKDATVEHLMVRIYRGAELDLHVKPFIKTGDDDSRRRIDLVQFNGKDFVDGDGDKWEFPVSEPVKEGDLIGVEAENKDGTYDYDFAMNVTIDRAGGTDRFGGLLDLFGRWL